MTEFFRCPCCGCRTFAEEPPGTFEICEVCNWEDDNVQFADPTREGGANQVSLRVARENYRAFGAIDRDSLRRGRVRPPTCDEL